MCGPYDHFAGFFDHLHAVSTVSAENGLKYKNKRKTEIQKQMKN
jgi:hypothetical protein